MAPKRSERPPKVGAKQPSVYEQPKHDTSSQAATQKLTATVTTVGRTAPVSAAFAKTIVRTQNAESDTDFWAAPNPTAAASSSSASTASPTKASPAKAKASPAPAAGAVAAASTASTLFPRSLIESTPLDMILYVPEWQNKNWEVADTSAVNYDRWEMLSLTAQDLSVLLHAAPPVFWSYLLHDPSIKAFIDSYLWYVQTQPSPFTTATGAGAAPKADKTSAAKAAKAQRAKNSKFNASDDDEDDDEDEDDADGAGDAVAAGGDSAGGDDFSSVHAQIARRVFFVLLRASSHLTAPGANTEVMPRSVHGKLIYDHWLFDVPKLLDICALYGPANPELTRTLVSNVLTAAPDLFDDLYNAAVVAVQTLTDINSAILKTDGSGRAKASAAELRTQSSVILDTVYKLTVFANLQFTTPAGVTAARGFVDAGLVQAIVQCYELTIPLIANELGVSVGKPASGAAPAAISIGAGDDDADEYNRSSTTRERDAVLVTARRHMLELVHNIWRTGYVTPLGGTDAKGANAESEAVNAFHQTFVDIAGLDKRADAGALLHSTLKKRVRWGAFVRHLDRKFQFHATLSAVKASSVLASGLGADKLKFVTGLFRNTKPAKNSWATRAGAPAAAANPMQAAGAGGAGGSAGLSNYQRGLPANIDALVAEVRSILGTLSIPFTQALLEHYGFEPQVAIDSVLEQKLPKALTDLQAKESVAKSKGVGVGNVSANARGDEFSKILDQDVDEDALGSGPTAFEAFLQRTGRVAKSDLQAYEADLLAKQKEDDDYGVYRRPENDVTKRKQQLNSFDDEKERAQTRESIIAFVKEKEAEYDDEFDDALDAYEVHDRGSSKQAATAAGGSLAGGRGRGGGGAKVPADPFDAALADAASGGARPFKPRGRVADFEDGDDDDDDSDDADDSKDGKFAMHKNRAVVTTNTVAVGKGINPAAAAAVAAARAAALGGHKDWRAPTTAAEIAKQEKARTDLLQPNANHAYRQPAAAAAAAPTASAAPASATAAAAEYARQRAAAAAKQQAAEYDDDEDDEGAGRRTATRAPPVKVWTNDRRRGGKLVANTYVHGVLNADDANTMHLAAATAQAQADAAAAEAQAAPAGGGRGGRGGGRGGARPVIPVGTVDVNELPQTDAGAAGGGGGRGGGRGRGGGAAADPKRAYARKEKRDIHNRANRAAKKRGFGAPPPQ